MVLEFPRDHHLFQDGIMAEKDGHSHNAVAPSDHNYKEAGLDVHIGKEAVPCVRSASNACGCAKCLTEDDWVIQVLARKKVLARKWV